MSNAAIFFDPEPYDATMSRPMGRNSAGEGFLRGFLKYADVDEIHLWNVFGRPQEELEAMVESLGPPSRPVVWIDRGDRAGLARSGGVHIPTPELQDEAWARRAVSSTAYSITGVTHTIAEAPLMAQLAGLLIGPLEPWDALICTSEPLRRAVETQLDAVADYLNERFGIKRLPPAQLTTIPLGVHPEDFASDREARARWRAQLGVPEDGLAALYLGRFSASTKMHPGPMGIALQQAANRLGRTVHWILYGGDRRPQEAAAFQAAAAAFCPSVQIHLAGESAMSARQGIWSAADVFISLSDNIQETFGLTPIEAMAAGIPCVVSDWNGYRDTVRHGIDGFRVRTVAPRAGLGSDLAYAHAHRALRYDSYVGTAALFTAVDVGEATEALCALFSDAELRARMGAAGRERVRDVFDWRVVIPQYQALWAELARRRLASPTQSPRPGGDNPWKLDPFRMFASYPTVTLAADHRVEPSGPWTGAELDQVIARAMLSAAAAYLPTPEEAKALVTLVSAESTTVGLLLESFRAERRPYLERGLVWLAKFGLVRLSGDPVRR